MQVSSSTFTLFASLAIVIFTSLAAAYMLKHPDRVQLMREAALRQIGIQAQRNQPATPEAEAATEPAPHTAGEVTIAAKDHGHFETEAEINGRSIDVMIDTGATLVALTYDDAERAGIYLRPADFTQRVSTANGEARIAPVEIDRISIGDITLRNIRGAVSEPGKLHRTLLGMSFLGKLSRVDMRSDTLILQE